MIIPNKVTASRFEETSSQILSEIDVKGKFDFHTFCIVLNALRMDCVGQAHSTLALKAEQPGPFAHEDYTALSRTLPLAYHEFTHFIDATATVWGATLLAQTSSAYTSEVPDETQFFRAKRHHDYLRGIRLPSYYTEVHLDPGQGQHWRCIPSIGKVFSSVGGVSGRPILFGRFLNDKEELLARSPVSMVSLLEASATAQEIFCRVELLRSSSGDFQAAETKALEEEVLRFRYDRRLTEYSVCVHLIANHLNCQDVLQAFMVCSIVVRAALNFPSDFFGKIPLSAISSVLGFAAVEPFAQSIFQGIKNGDRGILFYLLCEALPQSSHENLSKARAGLSSAMRALQINEAEAASAAMLEVWSLSRERYEGEGASMAALRSASLENFTASTEGKPSVQLPWTRLHLPPVLLGDDEIALIAGRKDSALAREGFFHECHDELRRGRNWMKKISEACL